MALNFNCPVALTKEALPNLRQTKGTILFISAIGGKHMSCSDILL